MPEKAHEVIALDPEAAYAVAGYGGIAWRTRGYATTWTDEEWEFVGGPDDELNYVCVEPEEVANLNMARMVMVGDDRVFEIDIADLTLIDEDDFCHGCGQIGCPHDGRVR